MIKYNYLQHLKDVRWKAKIVQIKIRDNHSCVNCKSLTNLQVHHRQYHFVKSLNNFKDPWDYPNDILITLCSNCHKLGHEKFQIPIINI